MKHADDFDEPRLYDPVVQHVHRLAHWALTAFLAAVTHMKTAQSGG